VAVWWWLVDALVVLVGVLALIVVCLLVRRRLLARLGRGTFDMSTNRRDGTAPKGWALGVAVYRSTRLEWYRTFSLSWRPRYRFTRSTLVIDGRRDPVGAEVYAVHAGHVIVPCDSPAGVRQLALHPRALTGLLAWLESSPPGQSVNNVL